MYTNYSDAYSSYLLHSGKKGMKWGIRNKKLNKQLNKHDNKKENKAKTKLQKQEAKLLDLYKKQKDADKMAVNGLMVSLGSLAIGSLLRQSRHYYVAKFGQELTKSFIIPLAIGGAYKLYSDELQSEQNHLQSKYGFRLDKSKLK